MSSSFSYLGAVSRVLRAERPTIGPEGRLVALHVAAAVVLGKLSPRQHTVLPRAPQGLVGGEQRHVANVHRVVP